MSIIPFLATARITLAALLLCVQPLFAAAQKPGEKGKHIPRTVWNFDGGVFLQTDGSLSENTCFRLAGRVIATDFFDNLKRVDDDAGTTFVHGKDAVTEFPDQVKLLFVIRDMPCPSQLNDVSSRVYLTREMMSQLHLTLYWKRGVDLRPIDKLKGGIYSVTKVAPYAAELANELPERLQWSYELEIPSAGVPLTDALVLIFRRADGRIAARVAARL
jgi:hypothetical protein